MPELMIPNTALKPLHHLLPPDLEILFQIMSKLHGDGTPDFEDHPIKRRALLEVTELLAGSIDPFNIQDGLVLRWMIEFIISPLTRLHVFILQSDKEPFFKSNLIGR